MRKLFLVGPVLLLLAACVTRPPHIEPDAGSDALWDMLMTQNQNYVDGSVTFAGLKLIREQTAGKQSPPVTFLSCADSRVPPELVFHQTVGDIFVIREAGNVADTFSVASIEYGVLNPDIRTRMIVVLGHEGCGAVKAAIQNAGGTPSLDALVKRIRDSVPNPPCTDPNDEGCVNRWVKLNAIASAKYLIAAKTSAEIRKAVCSTPATVALRTAYYNLVSGRVELIPFDAGEACRAPGVE